MIHSGSGPAMRVEFLYFEVWMDISDLVLVIPGILND